MGHATQYAYAVGRGFQFVFNKPDIMLDTLILDKYVGHYEFGMHITRADKLIYVNFPNGRVKLHAQTNEKFYANGMPGTTEFTKDDKGKVIGYTMRAEGNVMMAKKHG